MPTATESRRGLQLLSGAAVERVGTLFERVSGSPEARRAALLDTVPDVIGYFTAGTAALAADFYQELRDSVVKPDGWQAELIVQDRTVKIRRAIAWSAAPLFDGDDATAAARLAGVVQLETARPYRDTITGNRRRDPEAVGWRRVTNGGCKFCRMLADRGAVYRHDTARFAAHEHCNCGAEPVFGPNDTGRTASAMQYVASRRSRTPAQRAALRDYLDTYY